MEETPQIAIELTAVSGRKGQWRLLLEDDQASFTSLEDNESFHIQREEADTLMALQNAILGSPFLIILVENKRIAFLLNKEQFAAIGKWLGPPSINALKLALKRRFTWNLPIGILFMITAIPLPGDPANNIKPVPFDAIAFFLGLALVIITILGKVKPMRILFFLDSLWFILLAANVAADVYHGSSYFWLVLVVMLLLGAKSGLNEFQRFSQLKIGGNSGAN